MTSLVSKSVSSHPKNIRASAVLDASPRCTAVTARRVAEVRDGSVVEPWCLLAATAVSLLTMARATAAIPTPLTTACPAAPVAMAAVSALLTMAVVSVVAAAAVSARCPAVVLAPFGLLLTGDLLEETVRIELMRWTHKHLRKCMHGTKYSVHVAHDSCDVCTRACVRLCACTRMDPRMHMALVRLPSSYLMLTTLPSRTTSRCDRSGPSRARSSPRLGHAPSGCQVQPSSRSTVRSFEAALLAKQRQLGTAVVGTHQRWRSRSRQMPSSPPSRTMPPMTCPSPSAAPQMLGCACPHPHLARHVVAVSPVVAECRS